MCGARGSKSRSYIVRIKIVNNKAVLSVVVNNSSGCAAKMLCLNSINIYVLLTNDKAKTINEAASNIYY